MKSIRTRYYGPTNTRGSRIVADDGDGNRVTMPYPHELSGDEVHRVVAEALRQKMGWGLTNAGALPLVGGGYRGDMYWVFVTQDGIPRASDYAAATRS
jgi:hypothetical protein